MFSSEPKGLSIALQHDTKLAKEKIFHHEYDNRGTSSHTNQFPIDKPGVINQSTNLPACQFYTPSSVNQ